MKREQEPQEKLHKQHRHKKDKLEKKLQYKKHKKKIKEKKKSEKESQKESPEETIARNIRTIVKKLLKYDASTENELPELFETLDKGNEVDIGGMEDVYAKHKLYKLFKLFGVPHARAKYAFKVVKQSRSTVPKWKVHTLKERITEIIKQCKETLKEVKEKSSEESDEEPEKVPHKKAKEMPSPPEIVPEVKEKEAPSKKGADFLNNTMKVIGGSVDEEEEFIGPMAPSDLLEAKRAQKKELLAEYNKIFRPKTLLEEHQERTGKQKKQEVVKHKSERLNEFMSRPFNRETDLDVTRVSSKEAFKAIHGGGGLDSKFGSSHFLHDQ